MSEITGSEILAKALRREGVDDLFFIMGGPMILTEQWCEKEGIRLLDVRHEQAAAFMAQAYSRLLNKPGGLHGGEWTRGHQSRDRRRQRLNRLCAGGRDRWIEPGQLLWPPGIFRRSTRSLSWKPCVKWADRAYHATRIPELVNTAFQNALSGKPGPVYLDCPGDVLYQTVEESSVDWSVSGRAPTRARPQGDPSKVAQLLDVLANAERPVIVSGSGILWSEAWDELRAFIDGAGIPFYTTPQGRGVIPEDHPYCYLTVRSAAFREADVIIVIGTRMNYIIGHAEPPRFSADATIARIDIDEAEINASPRPVDIGIVGDAKAVLEQLTSGLDGRMTTDTYQSWRKRLSDEEAEKRSRPGGNRLSDDVPNPSVKALRRGQELHAA